MVTFSLINKNKQAQISAPPEELDVVRENFSTANPSYRRNSGRFIPARLYSITPQGKFEIGLLREILEFLQLSNIPFQVPEDLKKIFNPTISLNKDFSISNLSKNYRDYQEQSIIAAIRQGRGVTIIPTAGGKTLIMAGVIKTICSLKQITGKILVLVPSLQLVEQTASDFEEYGLKDVSKWSGSNELNYDSDIIVAGTQILMSDKTDLSILADVELLLVDEVHSLKRGNRINEVLKLVPTIHKFGFTGTMPSQKIDQWNIIGKIGPVTYEQKTHTLKEQSHVSKFKIIILNVIHNNAVNFDVDFSQPALAYQQELEFLTNNARRNEIIVNLTLKLKENSLIMVDRIEHGNLIYEQLSNSANLKDRPVYFIQGATEVEDREKIRALMDARRDVIVVAISKIFSTGINIPNLHNIIFATIGKAKIKIMQSIGRALRLHHTKTEATIFDIADNTKYGSKHVLERKKMYNLEKYEYIEKEIHA
jgi:superfamily II DNA or RNA helicase